MQLEKDPINMTITGVGGQGNVIASQILGQMLVSRGYFVTIGETYGSSQRGGSVMSHLRISRRDHFSPIMPTGQCDLVLGLEPMEGLRVLASYGNQDTLVLVNTRPVYPIDVITGHAKYPELPVLLSHIQKMSSQVWVLNATEIALQMGNPILSNIIMMGALSGLAIFPMGEGDFINVAKELLPTHALNLNVAAFNEGMKAVRELLPNDIEMQDRQANENKE